MSRFPALSSVILLVTALAAGFARAGESYSVIHVNGQVSGYGKTTTTKVADSTTELYESISSQTFRMSRLNVAVEVAMEQSVVEDAAGRIQRMSSRATLAKNDTIYEGVVANGKLNYTVTTAGQPREYSIDFDDDIIGPRERNRRLAATKFEPGTAVTFQQFEFAVGGSFEVTYTFEATETVSDLPSGARKLHRLRTSSDNAAVPPATVWVDDSGETRKEATDMIGMALVSLDATRQQYEEAGGTKGAEIFVQSMIESNRLLRDPRNLEELVYRLREKSAGKLSLPEDARQGWITVNDEKLFRVRASLPPNGGKQQLNWRFDDAERRDALAPNPLVQSDDPKIVAFAREVVGSETNAWAAAQLLERAVFTHIKDKNMGVAFASATEVFEECQGDCTEHAVLLAACCRAVGIPTRVAMGLVYVEMNGKGVFGGHAWVEVSIDDGWYGLDATLGTGSADPTHIRMAAGSLKDGAFQSAFSGILQNLGNISLEIVSEAR